MRSLICSLVCLSRLPAPVAVLCLLALSWSPGAHAEDVLTYGYAGREANAGGWVYYRGRSLDPALGRFTQRDPLGLAGGGNDYAYVGDNPVSVTDPSGLAPSDTYADALAQIAPLPEHDLMAWMRRQLVPPPPSGLQQATQLTLLALGAVSNPLGTLGMAVLGELSGPRPQDPFKELAVNEVVGGGNLIRLVRGGFAFFGSFRAPFEYAQRSAILPEPGSNSVYLYRDVRWAMMNALRPDEMYGLGTFYTVSLRQTGVQRTLPGYPRDIEVIKVPYVDWSDVHSSRMVQVVPQIVDSSPVYRFLGLPAPEPNIFPWPRWVSGVRNNPAYRPR